MNDTLTLIISSGAISALVSFCSIFIMVGKYKEKVDNNQTNLKDYNKIMLEIRDKVFKLEGGIERDRANNEYIQRKSPLSLTEKGKAVLLDSKGKDFIDDNKKGLLKEIKAQRPKTAYDVQELSRDVIKNQQQKDKFNQIKEFAFKQGLELPIIIDIMGIYLRDEILPELGFDLKDLPNK